MPKLKISDKAPAFKLKDKDGFIHSLNQVESDFCVVYFYPKDNTPGCTIEAKAFNTALGKLNRMDAKIIGISGGDEKTKNAFCKKHGLKVTLLSDPDFKISKKYGVYGKKNFMGKVFNGILRKTFLLDKNKKILKIYHKVAPESHPAEILADIKNLYRR